MNLFGNYPSREAAANDLIHRGFKPRSYIIAGKDTGTIYAKPSTNGVTGAPQTALVEIIEQTVAPEYNQPNYYQHGYL